MTTTNERNRLIQHHLEEASTHLGMVKQLLPETRAGAHTLEHLTKVGRYLKQVYVRHGGHPDA